MPLDGSPFGEHALPLALGIARRAGEHVRLVHVHRPLVSTFDSGGLYYDSGLDAWLRRRRQEYLDGLLRRLAKATSVRVTPLLLEGREVAASLCEVASAATDLVVMATHGRGPLGRLWHGGVARLQRMPDKPAEELVVALAGPAVNVVIAAVLFFILGRASGNDEVAHLEDPRTDVLARLAGVNVMLVLFNLIPAFPMDGGCVLRALLAMRLSYARATQVAASVGQGIAFLFGFLGLFGNPLLIFIAIFIYLGAASEAGLAQVKEVTTGMPVSEAMVTHFVALPPDARIGQAVEALLRTTQHEFPVTDATGGLAGILTRDDIIRGLREAGPEAPAADVMHRGVPVVHHQASFDEAFRQMQQCQCPGLGVVNSRGQLVGLVTPESGGEMMMVRSVLPRDLAASWRRPESGAGMHG